MLIYRVAKDNDGDVGCFLLVRKDDKLMWKWEGFEHRIKSDEPKLNRIIDANTYINSNGLFTPFLEEDLDYGNLWTQHTTES